MRRDNKMMCRSQYRGKQGHHRQGFLRPEVRRKSVREYEAHAGEREGLTPSHTCGDIGCLPCGAARHEAEG